MKTNSREKRSSIRIHVNTSPNLEMEWNSSHFSLITVEQNEEKPFWTLVTTTMNKNSSKNLVSLHQKRFND